MTEEDFRDLVERAHQIDELTKHPGWQFFVDRAHATMSMRQLRVLNGVPATLEEYKRDTGWLEGADFVLKLPEQVQAEVETARQGQG